MPCSVPEGAVSWWCLVEVAWKVSPGCPHLTWLLFDLSPLATLPKPLAHPCPSGVPGVSWSCWGQC